MAQYGDLREPCSKLANDQWLYDDFAGGSKVHCVRMLSSELQISQHAQFIFSLVACWYISC
jgi:hypothetical protein